jgi:hypothetical protein
MRALITPARLHMMRNDDPAPAEQRNEIGAVSFDHLISAAKQRERHTAWGRDDGIGQELAVGVISQGSRVPDAEN